jgi:hypothetical protein
MWLIDLILNLAALLLWLKWRETKIPQRELPGISLVGTLKRTGTKRRQPVFLLILLVLLVFRPVIYWQLGSALHWTPRISLGAIALPFRSDHFARIFCYSFLSFAALLACFYLTLIFFSLVNGRELDNDPFQRMIKDHLGWIDVLPGFMKVLLPWVAMLVIWMPASWAFAKTGILPPAKSFVLTIGQGAVLGVSIFMFWRFVIAGLLLLYLLDSYIYFGTAPIWNFVHLSGGRILRAISWLPLRLGKIDFAPVVFAVVVFIAMEWLVRGLMWIYQRLPA